MPTNDHIRVEELSLDLRNYRTVPQHDEVTALHAMVAMDSERFWALTESLIDDGFIPTENIIILREQGRRGARVVKEGNRRTAALKLCLGYISGDGLEIPSAIEEKIAAIDEQWRTSNDTVPCVVFELAEAATAARIVGRVHGKGDKAGRAGWNAVAKARHNRNENGASEPGLDALEKYLVSGRNLTDSQKEAWGGEYPLTVLGEALTRLAPRFNKASARELAEHYPSNVRPKTALEKVFLAIGRGEIGFREVRAVDFGNTQGIPPVSPPPNTASSGPSGGGASGSGTSAGATGSGGASTGAGGSSSGTQGQRARAFPINDPRTVRSALRLFVPRGPRREKVASLLEEIRHLKIAVHPHAFCFLLRSMFEISAKAYCADHAAQGGPSATASGGTDRALKDVLTDIYGHLIRSPGNARPNQAMVRMLHGAHAEVSRPSGFLSVTSMNQLIHNPNFSVDETHICTLFSNVFPLLREMNK